MLAHNGRDWGTRGMGGVRKWKQHLVESHDDPHQVGAPEQLRDPPYQARASVVERQSGSRARNADG
eukprot:642541-Rhodomonas_salina.1